MFDLNGKQGQHFFYIEKHIAPTRERDRLGALLLGAASAHRVSGECLALLRTVSIRQRERLIRDLDEHCSRVILSPSLLSV